MPNGGLHSCECSPCETLSELALKAEKKITQLEEGLKGRDNIIKKLSSEIKDLRTTIKTLKRISGDGTDTI